MPTPRSTVISAQTETTTTTGMTIKRMYGGRGVSIGGSGKGRGGGAARLQRQVLIKLQHYLHKYMYIPVVCGIVMVGVMNGAPLVGGSDAVCVGVWSCIFVLFGVLDEVPIVGGDVSVTVGVRSPVGSTVLMLLVALGPVEM